jgi:hypothetical protein
MISITASGTMNRIDRPSFTLRRMSVEDRPICGIRARISLRRT